MSIYYTNERAQWWVSRSKTLAHQKAYDSIASRVVPTSHSVVVDCGCGNGELLKRIYGNYTRKAKAKNLQDPLLIGTDISSEMLREALDNLQNSGIEARIAENIGEFYRYRGVVLVEDDLTNSVFPSEISDVTFLTFPELQTVITPAVAEFATNNFASDNKKLTFLLQYNWLARVTKRGKHVILVDYDIEPEGGGEVYDRTHRKTEQDLASRFGLQIIRTAFVCDEEIFSDLTSERQDHFRRSGTKRGYRILTLRRL